MGRDDILALLESDIEDPGAYKSGEYLETHVLRHCVAALKADKQSLIEALEEWLTSRSDPRTMLALRLAGRLGLQELAAGITLLRQDVARGTAFPRFYLTDIDETLRTLAGKDSVQAAGADQRSPYRTNGGSKFVDLPVDGSARIEILSPFGAVSEPYAPRWANSLCVLHVGSAVHPLRLPLEVCWDALDGK